jgi:hypothetical protein
VIISLPKSTLFPGLFLYSAFSISLLSADCIIQVKVPTLMVKMGLKMVRKNIKKRAHFDIEYRAHLSQYSSRFSGIALITTRSYYPDSPRAVVWNR